MAASREEIALGARYGNFYTAHALDAVREPVLLLDSVNARFNIILANAASRRLFRHQHSSIVGSSTLEFLEFASRQPFMDAIARLKRGSGVELQQITWTGPNFDVDCATEFKLLADTDIGEVVMLTLPSVDASSTLARITDWLKLSMRAAHIYAWRWERHTDQFELVLPDDLSRYVPPDFRGMQGFFARVHADDFDRVSRSVQLAMDEGVEFKEEFCFRMSDDQYRWYASVGRPMLDEAGKVTGLVGATQDVTNRRTTQARVHEYGELVRTATANTADVLLLLDSERMRLEREILEISAREQERIGQDLHDGLGQELTGVALMLRSLSTKIRRDYPNATEDVDDIIAVVNRSIETARSLARGLSPLNSERGGLVHALRSLAARSRESYGLNVHFRSKIWPQLTLDENRCSHLYRIAQEALTNIARHAQASRADVRLLVADSKFTLTISDDGVGLDRSFKSINGMGLKLMAYRAGMIGAKLDIAPNEPRGTIVRISGDQPPLM